MRGREPDSGSRTTRPKPRRGFLAGCRIVVRNLDSYYCYWTNIIRNYSIAGADTVSVSNFSRVS